MIIGISGKARSGKDTFAIMLASALNRDEHFPYVFMAYAHEMKVRIQKDFNLEYDQLWGDKKEIPDLRYPKPGKSFSSNPADFWTPREIMQAYGEFYRSIDYDFWVKILFNIIDFKEYKNVIITDCRHINEVEAPKNAGGYHVRVVRPGADANVHGKSHISEVGLDNHGSTVDILVENTGTLQDLEIKAAETALRLRELSGTSRKPSLKGEYNNGKKQRYEH